MKRLFYLFIAQILLVTAGLKLWMLLTDPFADLHSGYPKIVLANAVLFELLLFGVNTFRKIDGLTWILNLCFFLIAFTAVSIRFMMGFGSCGCVGVINIAPIYFVMLDASIIAALSCDSLRENDCFSNLAKIWRDRKPIVVGAAISIFVFSMLAIDRSNFAWSSYTLNNQVVANHVNIGVATQSKPITATASIKNSAEYPVTIVGHNTSCACLHIESGHRKIGPNSLEALSVVLVPKTPGRFWQRVIYYLDSPEINQETVFVDFVGFVK